MLKFLGLCSSVFRPCNLEMEGYSVPDTYSHVIDRNRIENVLKRPVDKGVVKRRYLLGTLK